MKFMTTEQKQDTILKNSCVEKLICEIWETKQELGLIHSPARGKEEFKYALDLLAKIDKLNKDLDETKI